jgi:hypothetical protein
MRLVRHPCDIKALVSSQAWANYTEAMSLADTARTGQQKLEYRATAALSARAWFDGCERLLAIADPAIMDRHVLDHSARGLVSQLAAAPRRAGLI